MTRLNEQFIEIMEQLATILSKQGEPFRARAYQKAQETIMSYAGNITSPEDLKGKPNIGTTIMEKLNEYVETGSLKIIEREKNNPVNILADVYGIGPKKAKELVDKGITSIVQLRENQQLLNDVQKIGLQYYEDVMKRIPRSEIDEYKHQLFQSLKKVEQNETGFAKPFLKVEIVGSYRRGAKDSGDIDIIITSSDLEQPLPKVDIIDELIKQKIIVSVLSRGPSKCLVMAKIPSSNTIRRVDFLYTSPEEFPFAILYFTGSKFFNTMMRQHAVNMGLTMNEHGLYKLEGKTKGEKVEHHFSSEKDIFDYLNLKYVEPTERIDGRSLIPLPKLQIITQFEEEPIQLAPKAPKAKTLKAKTLKAKTLKAKNPLLKKVKQNEDPFPKMEPNLTPFLEKMEEEELVAMLNHANNQYVNFQPIMSDNEYDILENYIKEKYPNNPALKQIGALPTKNKVTLPYFMGSMDKIKPDTNALDIWKSKYQGPYVLSCKLDGVSGLYTTEGPTPHLYTRGDGKVGQDISHLIPYLRLPKNPNLVIRGEFIISKETFNTKYKATFANARNMVSGIINQKSVNPSFLKDVDFVAYELIKPLKKPSEQMTTLQQLDINVVPLLKNPLLKNPLLKKVEQNETNLAQPFLKVDKETNLAQPFLKVDKETNLAQPFLKVDKVDNEFLSETLVEWRNTSPYEIDGVIVTNDQIYTRKEGNPEHSFAFKMVLSDQIAEAKVVDVIWTPSKDGYLKPRVQIEPINLGGVKIEYATGFNGQFIQDNKVGIGAVIQLIRSGDVIPHIKKVTTPANQAKMPDVPYKWSSTHVDVLLEDIESDEIVKSKNITGFFKGIEVEGLSSGNINRIIQTGFDSVPKILKMTIQELLQVEGFKEKTAQKLYTNIQTKIQTAPLVTIMAASNIFGRGFNNKKLELIFETYPDVIHSNESQTIKTQKVAAIKGMATKTAEAFVDKIPAFLAFVKEANLDSKLLQEQNQNHNHNQTIDQSNPLYNKTIVFTGFRNKEFEDKLKEMGAKIGSSISKNTFILLVKDPLDETGKVLDAKKLNIPVMTPEEFYSIHFKKSNYNVS